MSKFFKSLRLSDFLLVLGIGAFIGMLVPGYEAMAKNDVVHLAQPLWLNIILFFTMILFYGLYILRERKKEVYNINKYLRVLFVLVLTISLIVILTQPETIDFVVTAKRPVIQTVGLSVPISFGTKMFMCMQIFGILSTIYLLIFNYSKRIKSINFIHILAVIFILLILASITWTIVKEANHYPGFVKALFAKDFEVSEVGKNAIKSFYLNKNMYAIILFLGLLLMGVAHHVSNKKIYFFFIAITYLETGFTFSRTGYILATGFILIFIYHKLFSHFKHSPKGIISTITISILLATVVVFLFVFVEEVRTRFTKLFFGGGMTFSSRTTIWEYCRAIVTDPLSFIIGRGYGTFNIALNDAIAAGLGESMTVSAHSWVFSLLGKGGLLYLALFLSIVIYGIVNSVKVYYRNRGLSFILIAAIALTIVYSLFEDFYYTTLVFVLLGIVANRCFKPKPVEAPQPVYNRLIIVNGQVIIQQ